MVTRFATSIVLCASLFGCDTLHRYLYNMTSCPISVTYSVGAMMNHTKVINPGNWIQSIGMGANRLDELTVVGADNKPRSFSATDLSKLRPKYALQDRFGWFDEGLRYLPEAPKTFPEELLPCVIRPSD